MIIPKYWKLKRKIFFVCFLWKLRPSTNLLLFYFLLFLLIVFAARFVRFFRSRVRVIARVGRSRGTAALLFGLLLVLHFPGSTQRETTVRCVLASPKNRLEGCNGFQKITHNLDFIQNWTSTYVLKKRQNECACDLVVDFLLEAAIHNCSVDWNENS